MQHRLWLLCLFILAGCAAATVPPSPESSPLPSASPTIVVTTPTNSLPTAVPTLTPTVAAASPVATAVPPTPTTIAQPDVVVPAYPAEIMFLRNGSLVALDPASGQERVLASGVRDWAVDASGRQIAIANDQGISIVDRASGVVRSVVNNRTAYGLSWTSDGLSFAYAAASEAPVLPFDWERWSRWCAAATVYIVDLPSATERTIGPGCDPVFASDGRRLAYATSPTMQPAFLPFPGQTNAIQLVNRAGANAWNPATADGTPDQGYLVYAPAWSPDARQVAYQRFLGYQALVDINLTMIADSSAGGGEPVLAGAGWHRPPVFAPDGERVAIVEYNFSDARGFTGYDIWKLYLVELRGERTEFLPGGDLTLRGQLIARIPRIVAAAWSPDGSSLAVLAPAAWNPTADANTPMYAEEAMGEIWQLLPQGTPQLRLTTAVDYASPLVWAPADLVTAQTANGTIRFPADWELLPAVQESDLMATANGRFIGRRTVADASLLSAAGWAQTVADWVTVADAESPYQLPDGSQLIAFRGQRSDGSAIAGVARLTSTAIIVSFAPQAEWPDYRASGIALVVAAR